MKIRDQILLVYTASSAAVLLGLGLAIYFFFSHFRTQEFFDRLNERVEITEKLFLEEKTLEPEVYQRFRSEFLHILPQEVEEVYELKEDRAAVEASLKALYPEAFVEKLFEKQSAMFEEDEKQGVGKIYTINQKDYVVIVTAVDTYGIRKLQDLSLILWIAYPFSILLIMIIGKVAAQRAFQPVMDKIQQVNAISASNLHLRLDIQNPNDEIGQLGMTFNRMLDRLETSFEIQKNFVSNASHELKNPLTAIIGEADYCLDKERSKEEYIQALKSIAVEADQLNNLVTNLLSLAKADFHSGTLFREDIRLDEILIEVMSQVQQRYPQQSLQFEASTLPENAELLEVPGNENLLRAAFTNLIDNACKFSQNKPVKIWLKERPQGMSVFIQDQGIGITSQDLHHILVPFFRAENVRQIKGFGIGLPLTDKIIRLHQGQLIVKSEPDKGTLVEVFFKSKFIG
jgi:signal transduction histidine kinase